MTSEKALVPFEQKQVVFYDDEITAVLVQVGNVNQIFVPIRPICDFLGVAWDPQRRRIYRDPVLSKRIESVTLTVTDAYRTIGRDMLCLPLDYLNGWLFGIDANRVKSEIKERIIRYQEECHKVLAEAFQEGRLSLADPIFDELLAQNTDEVQAYKMIQAMLKLARNQIMLRAELEAHSGKLLTHDQQLGEHAERLDQLEAKLGDPVRYVTSAQASRISQAVKAIALALGKRSARNEFGGVYGELYRRFEIAAYRELPAARYDEAMRFLSDWYASLTGGDIPF